MTLETTYQDLLATRQRLRCRIYYSSTSETNTVVSIVDNGIVVSAQVPLDKINDFNTKIKHFCGKPFAIKPRRFVTMDFSKENTSFVNEYAPPSDEEWVLEEILSHIEYSEATLPEGEEIKFSIFVAGNWITVASYKTIQDLISSGHAPVYSSPSGAIKPYVTVPFRYTKLTTDDESRELVLNGAMGMKLKIELTGSTPIQNCTFCKSSLRFITTKILSA
jgi:hypothetical protein